MRTHVIVASAALLLLISSCCQPPATKDYGLFPLKTGGKKALNFAANAGIRSFSGGASGLIQCTYTQPTFYVSSGGAFNCQETKRCGTFCDQYSEEVGGTAFQSSDMPYVVQFRIGKNFLKHAPTEPADSVSDMLSVVGQNIPQTNFALDALPAPSVVTLNGKTFNNVYSIGTAPTPPYDAENTLPAVYYFSLTDGVVGWVEYSGRSWNWVQ